VFPPLSFPPPHAASPCLLPLHNPLPSLNSLFAPLSIYITHEQITPDGHCLFSAIADQLAVLNVVPPQEAHYLLARQAAAEYMLAHPQDFVPFLPSVEGEDGTGAGDSGIIDPQEYGRYCTSIRDTSVWGGEPEILALSRAYAVPIHVVQGGQPPVVVHDPNGAPTTNNLKEQRAVWISYHRRMYGLGEVRIIIHSPADWKLLIF
jgi:OTU domain-containing protein 6